MSETVEVLGEIPFAITPGETWAPHVGEELLAFLPSVHVDSREKTRDETCKILARGVGPGQQAASAGLVVGYVQSGKTTSFTAAAALARDNSFALVIVIAGTSTNLLEQTQERLAADLGLHEKTAYRRWVQIKSPKPATENAAKIEAALADWFDEDLLDDDRATVLITVMKQHRHLEWLIQVLDDIAVRQDLSRVSALIIDDEADQASPNVNRKPGEESATYGRIRRVRAALPSHTLLEYTATPQATLLVSLVDELSPDYVCVIDPGTAYTGGKYFFQDHRRDFIRHIPDVDVQAIDDESVAPPASLQDAFACFALGCAAGKIIGGEPAQRSMLVHPSQKTLPQARFVHWLKSIRDLWADLVKASPDDMDRQALVEKWLAPGYQDLAESVADLPPFDDLLARLPGVLKKTTVVEVNASKGKTRPIEWPTGYSWVLVGGQLLDRGFTVEGLTVTYMPRSLGVGNADTVQQRARFFGYKQSYAGFCRAWLDPGVDAAFSGYVDHEEHMRGELVAVAQAGESLKKWKRIFLLDRNMKPTRASVIRLDTSRSSFANRWLGQRWFDGVDAALIDPNRELVDDLCARYEFADDVGDSRRVEETQVHPYVDLELRVVLERLLQGFVMTDEDSNEFAALRVLLAVAEDEGAEPCRVHLMGGKANIRRMRSLDDHGRIKNLFQGSNINTGYPGDRAVHAPDSVTVQVHRLDLHGDDGTDEGATGELLLPDTPVLAIWVPERFDTSVIVQRLT